MKVIAKNTLRKLPQATFLLLPESKMLHDSNESLGNAPKFSISNNLIPVCNAELIGAEDDLRFEGNLMRGVLKLELNLF